jgi:hypothetical protein
MQKSNLYNYNLFNNLIFINNNIFIFIKSVKIHAKLVIIINIINFLNNIYKKIGIGPLKSQW